MIYSLAFSINIIYLSKNRKINFYIVHYRKIKNSSNDIAYCSCSGLNEPRRPRGETGRDLTHRRWRQHLSGRYAQAAWSSSSRELAPAAATGVATSRASITTGRRRRYAHARGASSSIAMIDYLSLNLRATTLTRITFSPQNSFGFLVWAIRSIFSAILAGEKTRSLFTWFGGNSWVFSHICGWFFGSFAFSPGTPRSAILTAPRDSRASAHSSPRIDN